MAPSNGIAVNTTGKHIERSNAIKSVQQAVGKPSLATLSLNDIQNPPAETKAPAASSEPGYTCVTQLADPSSVASILVGLFDHIPRWKKGSVINFATYAEGYPTPADAVYAAKKLIEATEVWNAARVGVTFRFVQNLDDAAFVLTYGGEKGGVLASAFFPNDQPLNTVFVYSYAFDKTPKTGGYTNYEILKEVFLHELGHVLGLRHEFALSPDRFEGGAWVLGSKNERSVMSYNFPPQIQQSDIEDTKVFYGLPPIKDFVPDN